MISNDVKANKRQQIEELVAVFRNFYKRHLQSLKYNIKTACILHLILVDILSMLGVVLLS